jgi:D-alanyl-D-alanine carboxypeptidase (penicillin-binding protein 5/6)
MDEPYIPIISEEERAARRAQRAAARKRKQRARRRQTLLQLAPVGAVILAALVLLAVWRRSPAAEPEEDLTAEPVAAASLELPEPEIEPAAVYTVSKTADTVQLGENIDSAYAVLIDLQSDTILAEKNADAVISPASMTKILTLLVAAEHVTDLDDTFTMTIDITDYCYQNGCSVVGLDVGETVTVRELLYGTILPSGADAALGLAYYVSGSQEAFVDLMNEKLEELGLSDTAHFTNCVGIYNEDHHCTVTDIAMILKAAMENDLCREVLNAHTYDTAPTEQHPDGQTLSNWFLRRIEDKDTGDIEVIGAKTGYVVQSGSCAASCGQDSDGNLYLCVTGDAGSSWRAIYDHAALYKDYCAGEEL